MNRILFCIGCVLVLSALIACVGACFWLPTSLSIRILSAVLIYAEIGFLHGISCGMTKYNVLSGLLWPGDIFMTGVRVLLSLKARR